ncbi:right-handed parallel beta-helix repeat-containing protein [Anabaena sp. UHCC 0399]|uniref:right-handed parallel beta-helix repeat-containing protein n=1 Tax=Anabaena sp. UHCC 0399 TaxID=3110238 RepID=UPI002B1F51FD|nr:right-handed parallel beta-helix repeat-containing protein [Anabaena sp. UHCC 0399]MEA5565301.1 right-handed parallel beta-helix repeat-containing protein [Anabaena sp. UHCC 0399]
MSLCINPRCTNPENPDNILFCQACGSELLLEGYYRVVSFLGGGGFGKTFVVYDARTQTTKVLKILTNNHPKAIELFQREAQVLTHLNHPGIPKVEANGYFIYFSRNSQEPLHCLVMEKIEGLDLGAYLTQREYRPIDQKLALQWLKEAVTILQQVHQQGLFHRDIKPSNIMLRADGRLALIDFGTARSITQTYIAKQSIGQVTGVVSAGYTPSEQINGQAVQQSDFFALGRTFVYLLTGKEPTDSLIYDGYSDELRWREHTTILPQFADLLDQMMARLPNQRPQNTQLILQKLAEIEKSLHPPVIFEPPKIPRRRLVKVFGFGGIGLVGSALLYTVFPKNKSTITVSKLAGSDYKTIAEAIENAQPNTRIVVQPGLYLEGVVINKPLEIIGDGSTADIVIESQNSDCIIMKSDHAKVSGLTLRCTAGKNNKKFYAVDIPQGELVLENCNISSDSLACVAIHNSTANPIIRNCEIHDSKASGVFVYDSGQGTIEDCYIFNSTLSGVTIQEGGNPTVQRCRIRDGGILIDKDGRGNISNCEIFSTTLGAGIEIRKNGNPSVEKCEIRDGKGGGVLVDNQGRGTIKECNIFNNTLSGVEIRNGSNIVIRDCKINRNQEYAIYIHNQGVGTVENSDLTGNVRGTFEIDETSQAQRSGNQE